MDNSNRYSDQLLPLITTEMFTRYPDQTVDILNKLIRLAQRKGSESTSSGGTGNLEDIVQTTTSYSDGGVNVVTAYLSDGTTQDFQIRNGHKGSQGDPGATGADATVSVGTTTTLPAGSNATVTNSGTSTAAVFDFGIPEGAQGADGAGVAAGGTTGQVLAKNSNTDYDTTWQSLATVATSGNYSDLTGTPTIPTVNNATLTIQKNGTNVQTFTANQSTNATANITVPTSFSGLSGTVANSQLGNGTINVGKIDWSTITAITSASTIFSATNYTVSSFKAYKIGRILILERLQFASHSSTTSGRQVATLKSEYRPTNTLRIPVQHGANESVRLGLVQSDGKLMEYAPNNITQDSLWYSGVWICPS